MNHEKLLDKMRLSLSDWSQDDFRKLYQGYGFICQERSKHTFYTHPDFPQLTASVSRHNRLPKGYASDAVKIIDRLLVLRSETMRATGENDGTNTGTTGNR